MSKTIIWEELEIHEIEYSDEHVQHPGVSLKIDPHHMMNANFNLSPGICRVIADTVGVDRFSPISRYRGIVVFGTLFDIDSVKNEINKNISNFFNRKDLGDKPKVKHIRRRRME